MALAFLVDKEYTRAQVAAAVGVVPLPSGGIWLTGHVEEAGVHFVFYNVGVPGRTGHDYDNYFDGDELVTKGRTGSRKAQPSVQRLTDTSSEVHVFWRTGSRDSFTYAGRGFAIKVTDDMPVQITWSFRGSSSRLPEEVEPKVEYLEGATKTVTVNAIERNPAARLACIRHHGATCCVCAFDFEKTFGELGTGYIHVHHLRLVARAKEEYRIDPVADLVPVCPNCHAMLHRTDPPMAPETLRDLRRRVSDQIVE